MPQQLIVTTTNNVEGYPVVRYLGIVRGLVVRMPTASQGLQALGGVLSGNFQAGAEMLAEVCEATRAEAYDRMVRHAQELGADAVIGMRYDSTDRETASEVLAYGTAVQLKIAEVIATT